MNVIPQRVRDGFGKLIEPLAVVFIRLHIRPNLITTVGTLVVIASATAFGLGWVRPGGLLLLVSGLFDLLDGRVARRADMTTTFGAFYDSTLDRVGEAALFGGIALYFLRGGGGRGARRGGARPANATRSGATPPRSSLGKDRNSGSRSRSGHRARQRKTGRDARGVGCGLHHVHRGRRERAARHRTADRLAVANGHHPPREAHREAEPEDQGVRAAHRLDGLGVRRLGPDSR